MKQLKMKSRFLALTTDLDKGRRSLKGSESNKGFYFDLLSYMLFKSSLY